MPPPMISTITEGFKPEHRRPAPWWRRTGPAADGPGAGIGADTPLQRQDWPVQATITLRGGASWVQ